MHQKHMTENETLREKKVRDRRIGETDYYSNARPCRRTSEFKLALRAIILDAAKDARSKKRSSTRKSKRSTEVSCLQNTPKTTQHNRQQCRRTGTAARTREL